MLEYDIVAEDFYDELVETVNQKMTLGWRPQGGIAMGTWGGHFHYCQAIVRGYETTIHVDSDLSDAVVKRIAEEIYGPSEDKS